MCRKREGILWRWVHGGERGYTVEMGYTGRDRFVHYLGGGRCPFKTCLALNIRILCLVVYVWGICMCSAHTLVCWWLPAEDKQTAGVLLYHFLFLIPLDRVFPRTRNSPFSGYTGWTPKTQRLFILPPCTGTTGAHALPCMALAWVPGIWIHVLMLA